MSRADRASDTSTGFRDRPRPEGPPPPRLVRLALHVDGWFGRRVCLSCGARTWQEGCYLGVFDVVAGAWSPVPSGAICHDCIRRDDLVTRLSLRDAEWPMVVQGAVPSAADLEAARLILSVEHERRRIGLQPLGVC